MNFETRVRLAELSPVLQILGRANCKQAPQAESKEADKPAQMTPAAAVFADLVRAEMRNPAPKKQRPWRLFGKKGIEGVGTAARPAGLAGLQFESERHAQLYAEFDRLLTAIIGANEADRAILRQRLADLLAPMVRGGADGR